MRHASVQLARPWLPLLMLAALGCSAPSDRDDDGGYVDPEEPGEGVAFDEQYPGVAGDMKTDMPHTYEIPEDLPELGRPEIIVSLDGLSVHLFDRAAGFSRIYPAGVGQRGQNGKSYTPAGFFKTERDVENYWYYIGRRYQPDYFGGFPFLRLNIFNSQGHHTYGMHGPITYTCGDGDCGLLDRDWFLVRDFVSHGCVRMDQHDIVELFWTVRKNPETPVSIQTEVERDAAGLELDVDSEVTLWLEGEPIVYGECGIRPDPYSVEGRWTSRKCEPQPAAE